MSNNEGAQQNGHARERAEEIVERLISEKGRRVHEATVPTVVDVGALTETPSNRGLWIPDNGSAFTLYVARRGSHILRELREALTNGDSARNLQERLRSQFESLPEISLDEAGRIVEGSDVFGALEYAGQSVVENLLVPTGLEVVALVFPYSGGRLNPDAFTLSQWRKPETEHGLEALVLYRELLPTTAEESASAVIGEEPHLAAAQCLRNGNWCMVGATYVGAAAAAAWAMAFAGPVPGAHDLADLGDAVVEDLSADELIDLRVRALYSDID